MEKLIELMQEAIEKLNKLKLKNKKYVKVDKK